LTDIIQSVKETVSSILENTPLQLVDVKYIKEGREWFLRVFINKDGGIEIEDCVFVSKQLSKILDEQDLIKTQYYLEVSSPGVNGAGDEGGKIE